MGHDPAKKMADYLTDKEEIGVVYQAAQRLGIADKLTSENPATKSGSTAELLMADIASIRPDIAARLRARAGVAPSLAALAAQHGYAEMSPEAKASLMESDERYVKSAAIDAQAEEDRILASMTANAEALARNNRGDRIVDAEQAKEADLNSPAARLHRQQQKQNAQDVQCIVNNARSIKRG